MSPKYVVVSNIITDDILLPEGTQYFGLLGGAGTYAAAGIRLWSDSVGIVSGIGDDFFDLHGDWFRQNTIDVTGLQVRDKHTPHSWVKYQTDGERTETPQFGAEHFRLMEPWPSHLPSDYLVAAGVYVFRDDNPVYWHEIAQLQAEMSAVWMWEIAANATFPDHWDNIARILPRVDILSLNRTEGRTLFQTDSMADMISQLLTAGVGVVVLRIGRDGALVANPEICWHIRPLETTVVDPTGAGNAFTGGFLAGYCESKDLRTAGIWGTISASYMLQQYGPPQRIDALQPQAHAQVNQIQAVKIDLLKEPKIE